MVDPEILEAREGANLGIGEGRNAWIIVQRKWAGDVEVDEGLA